MMRSLRAKLSTVAALSLATLALAVFASYELLTAGHYHAVSFERLRAVQLMRDSYTQLQQVPERNEQAQGAAGTLDLQLRTLQAGLADFEAATRDCLTSASPTGRLVLSAIQDWNILQSCRDDLERIEDLRPAIDRAVLLEQADDAFLARLGEALTLFDARATGMGEPVQRIGDLVATSLSIIFGIAALGMLGLTVSLLINTNPVLRRLQGVTEAFARGDYRERIADCDRKDELGAMARSLNRLKQAEIDRRETEARLRDLSEHDVLTGLANATLLRDRLDDLIRSALTTGQQTALVRLDLLETDSFRRLSDTATQDQLVMAATDRLRQACPHANVLARIDGFRWAIVESGRRASEMASITGARAIGALTRPYVLDGQTVVVDAAAGLAVSPANGHTADQLLSKATQALALGKETVGPGHVHFFDQAQYVSLQEELALKDDLRQAVTRNELRLYLQPQAGCTDVCGLVGFEALVRWQRADGSFVSPGKFIPIAEDLGLIDDIGLWVLRESCRHAKTWPSPLDISVNLSTQQFANPRIVQIVQAVLKETGLPAERLTLEITESVFMEALEEAQCTFSALKALGCQIALDDFGTGFSSLGYIRQLDFDKIKVDRSFVVNIETDKRSREIMRAIIQLGEALASPVVAEGVETQAQLRALLALGCDIVQGYLLDKPLPADAAVDKHLRSPDSSALRMAALSVAE